MEAIELLKEAEKSGATLGVVDEDLKGKNLDNLNQKTRRQLRQRKAEIIQLLQPKPFLKEDCELVIPLTAPDKYRWWAGGQSIFDTLLELDAPDSVIEHYIGRIESPADWRRWQGIMEERIAARPVGGQQGVF